MDDTVATISAEDDGWFKLAVEDTAVVADVLLLLKHANPPPPPPRTSNRRNDCPALGLEWSVRQRRSKHVPRQQHDEAAKNRKKGDSSGGGGGDGGGARASPTTPLSWSGGTSVSGGGCGGDEESSKPGKPTGAARSKLPVRSGTIISKRPRKKKTVAEFKEVETLLLKERKALKNELATLRFTVDKQRATNETLKRMKLHLQFAQTTMTATNSPVSSEAIWHQHAQVIAVGHPTTINATNSHCNDIGTSQSSCQPNISCNVQEIRTRDTAFSLPDLNIPFGEDPCSEVL